MSILFNHRPFPKPAVFPGFLQVFQKEGSLEGMGKGVHESRILRSSLGPSVKIMAIPSQACPHFPWRNQRCPKEPGNSLELQANPAATRKACHLLSRLGLQKMVCFSQFDVGKGTRARASLEKPKGQIGWLPIVAKPHVNLFQPKFYMEVFVS